MSKSKDRTPERQALADAIVAVAEAERAVSSIEDARGNLSRKIDAAEAEFEDAKAAVKDAVDAYSSSFGETGIEPITAAKSRSAKAYEELEMLQSLYASGPKELEDARFRIQMKRMTLEDARKAVIDASPEVAALVAKFRETYLEAQRLEGLIMSFQSHGSWRVFPGFGVPRETPWAATFNRLLSNPDEPFPKP